MATGVGARDHLDAGRERAPDALDVMRAQRVGALTHVWRGRLAMILVDRQGRDEEDVALGHHRDQLSVLVEVAAVLDRIDPRLDRDAQPGSTEGVAHHAPAERVRFVHERFHLFQRELGILRPVTGARAGPAGRRALDHVRAGSDHRADRRPHRLDAVGDARRKPRIGLGGRPVARRAHTIAQASGRRDDRERQHEPRSRDQPFLDGDAKPRVEPAGVADRRVAGLEDLSGDGRCAQMPRRARLVETPALRELVAMEGEVIVAVDEPGQHGEARGVDHLGAGRPASARPGRRHGLDPAVVDLNHRVTHRRSSGAVDQGTRSDDFHCSQPFTEPAVRPAT